MIQVDVADGVHRVEEALTNWYLVEEGTALTVVDAGFPRSWGTLHEALRRIGRSPADVAAVVLTHAHFDHVGFAERARTELGAPVWVHELDVSLARHPWRYRHERSRVPYMLAHPGFDRVFAAMAARGALTVPGVERVRTFRDGDVLDVPGSPRAIHTPGHTHGHCALHLEARGVVFAGDAFVMHDPYTRRDGPRIVAGAATADSARALASLDALRPLGADRILTGHGEPWRGPPADAVDRAQAAGAS
jgi:glyoxylase-like metal-dependent hydrolase (beta-lactamase superfamily II)